jgi:hypothetical protein
MGVLRDPSEWDPLESEGLEPSVQHKVVRPAMRPLGHGCLVCPSCELPLLPLTVGVTAALECPFCREVRPARHFLRLGKVDTPGNAISVRARLPAT